jgi:hypothetical protein
LKEARRPAVDHRSDAGPVQLLGACLAARPAEPAQAETAARAVFVPLAEVLLVFARSAQLPPAAPQRVRQVGLEPRQELPGEPVLWVLEMLRELRPAARLAEPCPPLWAVLLPDAPELPLGALPPGQPPERPRVSSEAPRVSGQRPEP